MVKVVSILLVVLLLFACKKNEDSCSDHKMNQDEVGTDCGGVCEPCQIEYPLTGNYGRNVLRPDTIMKLVDTIVQPGTFNSLRAHIPEGSSLYLEMTTLAGTGWVYWSGSVTGWSITPISSNTTLVQALNSGVADLHLAKYAGPVDTGVVLIKYFENSNELTRETYLIWE